MGTEIFKAASGREVRPNEDGSIMFGRAIGYLQREAVIDAEEYFQAKRDAELGWWRWPENPNYIVRPLAGQALVINERTGRSHVFGRDDDSGEWALADAAEAYFKAHPEPKPWHDAKPGEVWLINDSMSALVTDGGLFLFSDRSAVGAEHIRTARRVWPEDAA